MVQTLRSRIIWLTTQYGSLRSAARSIGLDAAYLKRLRDGEKDSPSDETLRRLNLKKKVTYIDA